MCSIPPSWSRSSRATAYVYKCTPTTARLAQHVRRRCSSGSQQVRWMCRGHQRLGECVQTPAERGQDAAVVARIESAVGQGRLPWRPGARHLRRHLWHRSQPRCCHRPWAVAGGPCHGRLSLRPVVRSLSVNATKTYGVHLVSPELLQLTAVWHQRRTTLTPPVGAERCRPPGHRRPSSWPHHTSVTAAALAANQSATRVQDRGARASVSRWSCSRVLVDDCRLLSDAGRRPLRSNSYDTRTHNKPADRSFSAAHPRLWNDLHDIYDCIFILV